MVGTQLPQRLRAEPSNEVLTKLEPLVLAVYAAPCLFARPPVLGGVSATSQRPEAKPSTVLEVQDREHLARTDQLASPRCLEWCRSGMPVSLDPPKIQRPTFA